MATKYFEIDGVALHVFHAGRTTLPGIPPDLSRGERLLFVHGAGSTGAAWSRQVAHFASAHSPVAFDFPGHGRSSGTEALPSVEAHAEWTLRLADRLGLDQFVVVGASMGGLVALELALRVPNRLRGLVLVATSARIVVGPEVLNTWRQVMLGRAPQPFTRFGYGNDAPAELVREGWGLQILTDPRVRYLDLVAASKADYRARLAEIRTPALVVHGLADPLVPEAAAVALAAGLAGAERVSLPGCGHYVSRERPGELAAAIDRFLARLSG